MKKANRTRGRGMQLSKERIEKDLAKLKRRMNQLYVEAMARERALELFTAINEPEVVPVETVAIDSEVK